MCNRRMLDSMPASSGGRATSLVHADTWVYSVCYRLSRDGETGRTPRIHRVLEGTGVPVKPSSHRVVCQRGIWHDV